MGTESLPTPRSLPAPLRKIRLDLEQQAPIESNLAELEQAWQATLEGIKADVPGICIESEGETVYWGELSPGCAACKAGTWDCLFITPRCNLKCAFCYSPLDLGENAPPSAFGNSLPEITRRHALTHITGVSFSGGEPFLEPSKLLEWVAWFREHHPGQYTWVYTNGLPIKADTLKELGRLGLNEIRFDMAATSYVHPVVLRNLSVAAEYIPNLTVEIPSIPADAEKLLDSLPEWSARGVKYLNLHELIYEPGSLSGSMPGDRQEVRLPDGHLTCIDPRSRPLTMEVIRRVAREHLPLAVNDCSLQSKLLQIRGRRRSLSPLSRQPYEKLIDDEAFESYCLVRAEDDFQFIHPDHLSRIERREAASRLFRLVRKAPLSLNGRKRWIDLEECAT